MADIDITVEGKDDLIDSLDTLSRKILSRAEKVIDKSMSNLAEDIKIVYKGGRNPGFQDRTGALRSSIRGGSIPSLGDEVIGFVGAGDDNLGENGRATREYVAYIEFGEFSQAGNTSFLRDGFKRFKKQILDDIAQGLNMDSVVRDRSVKFGGN